MYNIPKFKLDPCYACKLKYDITDINNINSCCTETAGAFAGQSSINGLLGTDANENCERCLNESKKALGKSDCVLRLTKAPIWVQSAHYFPNLFVNTNGDKDKALKMCYQQCKEDSNYPRQCMINCETDYNAIIPNDINESYYSNKRTSGQQNEMSLSNNIKKKKKDEMNSEDEEEHFKIKEKFCLFSGCSGDKCKTNIKTWIISIILLALIILTFIALNKKN